VAGRPAHRARQAPQPRSQHFLRSARLASALVADAGVAPGELVVDVGAGGGRLTAPLAAAGARVVAVELDPVWAARLRARFAGQPNVTVVEADALAFRLPSEPFRVVANPPFHITTATLRRLLDDAAVPLARADVIVEWAVARKRATPWPSSLLTVLWSARFELAAVRRLPAACFEPKPETDAGSLRAVRRERPLVAAGEWPRFRRFVEAGFRSRDRPLRQARAAAAPPRRWKQVARELGVEPSAAARDLDAYQWAALFDAVSRAGAPTRA
jgi:23S rRNA (adenine-N6)-dimethyltransferase